MGNNHQTKAAITTALGLTLTTGTVFFIIYICLVRPKPQDWIFWSVIASIALNAGLLFVRSGVVHKIKADMIRRQKQRSRE